MKRFVSCRVVSRFGAQSGIALVPIRSTSNILPSAQTAFSYVQKPKYINVRSYSRVNPFKGNEDEPQSDYSKVITKPEMINILEEFREITQSNEDVQAKFLALRFSERDHIQKWQDMMRYLIKIMEKVLLRYGMSLEQFKEALERTVARDGNGESEIFKLYVSNWNYWIQLVYGVDYSVEEGKVIPKKDMVNLIQQFLSDLSTPEFTNSISKILQSPDPVPVKGEKILLKVAQQHQKVMGKYGFEGERGYLDCQRGAIVNYFGDKDIKNLTNTISKIVYNYAAKLNPHNQ